MFIQVRSFFLNELPRRLVFFVRVGAIEVERQLIGCGFRHEVVPVFKILDLVEFRLHEIVNRFDIRLHAMRSWVDGVVVLSRKQFNGSCVGRGFFCVPGANIFAAVIGLPDGSLGKGLELPEEVIDVGGEEMGVGQRDAFGKAEEEDAAGDLTEGVLNLRQVARSGLEIVFRDVHEVFGVLHGLLEELKAHLYGAEVIFRDVLFRPSP